MKAAAAIPLALFALALIAVPLGLHKAGFDALPAWTEGCIYCAAAVLSVGSICGLCEVLRNRASRGVVTVAWTIVATVAMATTAIPYFNPYLGYKSLCERAKTFGAKHYAYYKFKYADNMDVFLGEAPQRTASVAELEA